MIANSVGKTITYQKKIGFSFVKLLEYLFKFSSFPKNLKSFVILRIVMPYSTYLLRQYVIT